MQNAPAISGPDAAQGEPVMMPDTISEGARRRLEARITELKLDREAVKKYVKDTFGRDHFTEMTKEEYEKLDKTIEIRAAKMELKAKAAQTATEGENMSDIKGDGYGSLSMTGCISAQPRSKRLPTPANAVKLDSSITTMMSQHLRSDAIRQCLQGVASPNHDRLRQDLAGAGAGGDGNVPPANEGAFPARRSARA